MVPRISNNPFHKEAISSYPSHSYSSSSRSRIFRLLSSSSLSSSDGNRDNNLETRRKDNAKTSDKLRDILNNLGMSISQWNIQEKDTNTNNKDADSSNMIDSDLLSRRRRTSRQVEHANPYLHTQTRSTKDFDLYSTSTRRRRNLMTRADDIISARLRVSAVHAASNFNITKVLTAVFGPSSTTPALNHVFGKTSIIVQLPPVARESEIHHGNDAIIHGSRSDKFFHLPDSQPRYVAIYRFGSIVFFNVSAKDAGDILEAAKTHGVNPVPRGFERKEHFEIAIAPQMQDIAHVNADFATVKELNINNVAIVSTIMGQTVAFDSCNDTVDELLAKFESINATVKRTGNCTAMERETLFKVVAQNNSLFIEMIARLGIKDRSDTAWNLSQYENLHEGMKVCSDMFVLKT